MACSETGAPKDARSAVSNLADRGLRPRGLHRAAPAPRRPRPARVPRSEATAYMVPAAYPVVDAVPLLPSGKMEPRVRRSYERPRDQPRW